MGRRFEFTWVTLQIATGIGEPGLNFGTEYAKLIGCQLLALKQWIFCVGHSARLCFIFLLALEFNFAHALELDFALPCS
jgi:hypothetical protein